MGILRQLPNDRARQRVLAFVSDYFAEQHAKLPFDGDADTVPPS
jgi:hypothetical protein